MDRMLFGPGVMGYLKDSGLPKYNPTKAKAIPATISEVVPLVDPSTRTFTAKADIRGPGLRTGAYGRIRFASSA